MDYKYISADNHLDLIWMPRDTWQRGLPARLREQGPKVVETDNGSFWEFEGELHGPAADGSDNERLLNILRDRGYDVPDGSLPPSDPRLLLESMDAGKMWAAVIFGGRTWKFARDEDLLRGIYSVYNDFAVELSQAAPERLIVLPNITARFPEECPSQIEALAKRGVKAVEFPYWDARTDLYEEDWEPTWAAAEETGVRLCGHLGAAAHGQDLIPSGRRGARSAWASAVPMTIARYIAELIFSGVFERHPSLRFCFAETRIGWAPFHMYWMDRQVEIGREDDPRFANTRPRGEAIKLSLKPSEYFKRNVVLTFDDDAVGVAGMADPRSGLAEVSLWGGDYPHPQGVWGPDLETRLSAMFDGVDEPVQRRAVFDNAARFFDIKAAVAA